MQVSKPAWWQLYATLPLMVLLLFAEGTWPLPGLSSQVATMGIVLLSFGAMLVWVHINGPRLERYYWERDGAGCDPHLIVYKLGLDAAKGDELDLGFGPPRSDCAECAERARILSLREDGDHPARMDEKIRDERSPDREHNSVYRFASRNGATNRVTQTARRRSES